MTLRKIICAVLASLVVGNLGFAGEIAFNVKLADAKAESGPL